MFLSDHFFFFIKSAYDQALIINATVIDPIIASFSNIFLHGNIAGKTFETFLPLDFLNQAENDLPGLITVAYNISNWKTM